MRTPKICCCSQNKLLKDENFRLQDQLKSLTEKNSKLEAAKKSNVSCFSKFKAMLWTVAHSPIELTCKGARVVKRTAEHTVTWETFRKLLIRVAVMATVIGGSGYVAALTKSPLLGGTAGVVLAGIGEEFAQSFYNALINEGVFA